MTAPEASAPSGAVSAAPAAAIEAPLEGARQQPARATVRSRLVALVLIALVPMACTALLAAYNMYSDERRVVVRTALETAKALSLVADREIAYRAAVLSTLAASPTLEADSLPAFHAQASAAARQGYQRAIVLTDLEGRAVLDTRGPAGTAPATVPSPPFRALAASAPASAPAGFEVSDLSSPEAGEPRRFAVRVPVVRDGMPRWRLVMESPASRLQRIFEQQLLPAGWTGTLIDSQGYVLARNLNADQSLGKRATPDMLQRLARETSGVHSTRTLDGTPVFTVFHRAPESQWYILIGIPRAEFEQPALHAVAWLSGVFLLLTLISVGVALVVGRTISEPVARLRADAEALGRGEVVAPVSTGLAETDTVQHTLARASRELRESDERLQTRVREAVAEAERAQRAALGTQKLEALGRLTGGIAHDFNNLLQTMTSGIKLALLRANDERTRQVLASCERAVSKAVRLTRQLMTFGSAQPGHREVIDLREQFDGLHDLLRGAVREPIALQIDIPSGLWPVELDPVQLELAVLNLALNARDAMDGGGTLQVQACNRSLALDEVAGVAPGEYLSLAVRDSGHGMTPELLARVFEPFFTTKPVGKGTGLGLAQVYAFAKQSGGGVTVNSAPGAGTEIVLWLPRSLDRPSPRGAAPGAATPLRLAGTVLLVEDDALVRGLTSEALERCGFQVLVAANADDALALVAARPSIQAVLSDVVMPGGKSGLDLMAELQRVRPALPVVLASGYAQALGELTEGRPQATVIAKPYDPEEVAQLIARRIAEAGDAPTRDA
jgi:signal transduction histidine kinase/ActR/RegA family two-component response regulator